MIKKKILYIFIIKKLNIYITNNKKFIVKNQ